MTPSQLDHLRRIDAHLANLLENAKKRTPGRWQNASRAETSDIIGHDKVCGGVYIASVSRMAWGEMDSEHGDANAAFVASCAGNAEAGWESTRGMIRTLIEIHKAMEGGKPGFVIEALTLCHDALLESILDQWPLELLANG